MEEERFSKDFAIVKKLYKENKDLVKQVILFGSVAEGTQNEESDIDVLFVTRGNQAAKFNNRIRKVCAFRDLRIGKHVCIEDLQGYGGKPCHPQESYLHLLKIDECDLKDIGPIGHSVKRGKNITGLLNGKFSLRQI